MKIETITKHCSTCDHSYHNINRLACRKGRKTYTLSQGEYGHHRDDAGQHCELYDPSQFVAIERRRGFKVEVL